MAAGAINLREVNRLNDQRKEWVMTEVMLKSEWSGIPRKREWVNAACGWWTEIDYVWLNVAAATVNLFDFAAGFDLI